MATKSNERNDMKAIDDKTTIPLTWVGGLLFVLLTVGAAGIWNTAFWVKGVNDKMQSFDSRLARFERAFHVEAPPEEVSLDNPNPFVSQAEAGTNRIIQAVHPQRKRR